MRLQLKGPSASIVSYWIRLPHWMRSKILVQGSWIRSLHDHAAPLSLHSRESLTPSITEIGHTRLTCIKEIVSSFKYRISRTRFLHECFGNFPPASKRDFDLRRRRSTPLLVRQSCALVIEALMYVPPQTALTSRSHIKVSMQR